MKIGEKEITLGPINADQTVSLIKFTVRVYNEIDEDVRMSLGEGLEKGKWMSFINILSSLHLYKLTSILTGATKEEIREHWTIIMFTDMLAELSEHNDLGQVAKNLQRAAACFVN